LKLKKKKSGQEPALEKKIKNLKTKNFPQETTH